uniref:RRM domain-containing protein n=1 Tax=Laticauda laticaudata TaxID=8630 RepID=A0A8C5RQ59_LATLA
MTRTCEELLKAIPLLSNSFQYLHGYLIRLWDSFKEKLCEVTSYLNVLIIMLRCYLPLGSWQSLFEDFLSFDQVQIRPWNLSDSDFVMDGSQPLDPRKTIFVGGVPRPLRAVELAMIMDRLYGGVCYAGIDTDPELKYPKGAGRVAFSNQQSYIAAISARFVQLQHGEIDKRVIKPYVLDDQLCDECQGARCGGKFAPFFCANVTCLQYYCEYCWACVHMQALKISALFCSPDSFALPS